jgi:hypothetical protein
MGLEDIISNLGGSKQESSLPRVDGGYTEPITFGDGVLFFDCVGEQFGKSLAHFIKTHKTRVQAMSANTNHNGYFVVVG